VLAQEAVELLRSHGFRASRLEDSVQDWLAHGLPVTKGTAAPKRHSRALDQV
jgi:rhodanese-related sulfurtransferase